MKWKILEFGKWSNWISKIDKDGFRIITNSGSDGNQDVPHFHVHVLGGKNLGRM